MHCKATFRRPGALQKVGLTFDQTSDETLDPALDATLVPALEPALRDALWGLRRAGMPDN